jgi:hypothetical protein
MQCVSVQTVLESDASLTKLSAADRNTVLSTLQQFDPVEHFLSAFSQIDTDFLLGANDADFLRFQPRYWRQDCPVTPGSNWLDSISNHGKSSWPLGWEQPLRYKLHRAARFAEDVERLGFWDPRLLPRSSLSLPAPPPPPPGAASTADGRAGTTGSPVPTADDDDLVSDSAAPPPPPRLPQPPPPPPAEPSTATMTASQAVYEAAVGAGLESAMDSAVGALQKGRGRAGHPAHAAPVYRSRPSRSASITGWADYAEHWYAKGVPWRLSRAELVTAAAEGTGSTGSSMGSGPGEGSGGAGPGGEEEEECRRIARRLLRRVCRLYAADYACAFRPPRTPVLPEVCRGIVRAGAGSTAAVPPAAAGAAGRRLWGAAGGTSHPDGAPAAALQAPAAAMPPPTGASYAAEQFAVAVAPEAVNLDARPEAEARRAQRHQERRARAFVRSLPPRAKSAAGTDSRHRAEAEAGAEVPRLRATGFVAPGAWLQARLRVLLGESLQPRCDLQKLDDSSFHYLMGPGEAVFPERHDGWDNVFINDDYRIAYLPHIPKVGAGELRTERPAHHSTAQSLP